MTDLVFDRKDVFSWSNAEEARRFIGTEGYFADSLRDLHKEVEAGTAQILLNVHEDNSINSIFRSDYYVSGMYLPADKVKKIEKKWRPYTLEEFLDKFLIGTQIKFRKKKELQIVVHGCGVLTGYSCNTNQVSEEDCFFVYLGVHAYSLEVLFETYEWQDENGNWCPFGVEE